MRVTRQKQKWKEKARRDRREESVVEWGEETQQLFATQPKQ